MRGGASLAVDQQRQHPPFIVRESMEASVQEVTKGFTRRAVEELSYRRHEPDWVREKRIEAWSAYETIPMPVRTDEEWRRTDIRKKTIQSNSIRKRKTKESKKRRVNQEKIELNR